MAKYMLSINNNYFRNAWNDEQKDFWVSHEGTLDTPLVISDSNFEKVIRNQIGRPTIVDGALVIGEDEDLGENAATLDEIKNGLSTLITALEYFIQNNVGVPATLPQDLTDLQTLQTAVNTGTAGLTFDGEGKTPAFGWVDALYIAGNTVAPVTFI